MAALIPDTSHRAVLSRVAAIAVVALLALALLVAKPGAASAAETVSCNSSSMYIVAHEDDTLLFQSPTIAQEIESGRCVRSVFLTAGDAGKAKAYWSSREGGVEAAYALMAGVADNWQGSTVTAAGHSMVLRTLIANPRISIVFMRLPDGGYPEGLGYAATGNQSLMKLWNGGSSTKGVPTESSISAIDGSNTFTYRSLIETLTGLMTSFEPRVVATQDFMETFSSEDHKDHVATAYFVRQAQKTYTKPHALLGYEGYADSGRAENVTGTLFEAKKSAFYLYGLYDEGACSEDAACGATPYASWIRRQYVAGQETTGVVANAGIIQNVSPGTAVTLNGSASSDESGHALSYKWTQTSGPTVTLTASTTAKPTLLAPSGKATLTFSLVVRDGLTESTADSVTVQVNAPEPPLASAGAPQSVASGAAVTLDGSASTDPAGRALTYSWTQTGGPAVTLSGSTTAKPTFAAPSGPATLTFSLVVSDGLQSSKAATVTVTVAAAAAETDIAPLATVTASSENLAEGQGSAKAVDGVISGYPENYRAEWATEGGMAGSWLQLKWSKSYTVDKVILYDRPNENDQITSGTLTFSDGSTVSFGALPNTGPTGLELTFPAHATTSLKMTVNTVKATTANVGLSEIEVFGSPTAGGGEPAPEPPLASAGAPQSVASGAAVTLDGSASTDPAGRALTYSWTQTGGPAVTLSGSTTAKPTFAAPSGPATLTFSLVVSDGLQSSKAATVTVTVAAAAAETDIAPLATVTASSENLAEGQGSAKAVDGVISGYPENYRAEWATEGGMAGSWLQLKWSKSYTVDKVILYDRPNENDQITSGTLTFSDGSTVSFGALPNTGPTGLELTFPAHATTSLKMTVNTVKATTANVGLSEIEVFGK